MKIDGTTTFAGIIGYPIEHTLSPSFQNIAFEHVGMNCVYLPFSVEPEKLETVFSGLAAAGCLGLNVTMPYKQAVYNLMDEVNNSAEIVEAVNTVEFRDGRSIGHNTDGIGFIRSLKSDSAFEPAGKIALVIGAGGAAKSIALSLAAAGISEIIILNRTREKAEILVRQIRAHFSGCTASIGDGGDPGVVRGCDLIVNATSVGMARKEDLPLKLDLLQPGQIVYDIIYSPAETEFLRLAREKGAGTANGAGMLLHQGAASFSIWTGLPAPIEEMTAALHAGLENRGNKCHQQAIDWNESY